MVLCLALGFLLSRNKPNKDDFYAREGLILVVLAWLMISLIGSLPYIFSGKVSSFIDALFESTSGFTTTGATVLTIEENVLPPFLAVLAQFFAGDRRYGLFVFHHQLAARYWSTGHFYHAR